MSNTDDRASNDEDPSDDVSLEEVMAAVDGLDPADSDWLELQWHVADRLHDRFLEDGDPADLDEAIRRGRLVIAFQGETSPAHLHDLALMLWDRIEPGQSPEDLRAYVRLLERALGGLDGGDDDPELRAKCQANLSAGLMSGDRHEPTASVRDRAVALWEAALASDTLDEDEQAGIAASLALALSWSGASEADLRQAVEYGRRSITKEQSDAEEGAQNEFALASALVSLHDVTEDDGLLAEAIHYARGGLSRLGPAHPDAPGYTANLVGLLRQQARENDDDGPLDEAVELARGAMAQTTDADSDHVLILTNAGAVLSESAARRDDPELLHESLGVYRQAVCLAPEGSAEQGVVLINLASTCRDGNERLDAPELIEEGVAAARRALAIFGTPGLHRAAALTALSNTLRDHFLLTGAVPDFDEALAHAEEALALTPTHNPERAARLTNLAVLLSDDFTERADRAQLDRAIDLYRNAMEAAERVGARVPERFNDLALALRDRHKDDGNRVDLDEAVQLAEATLTASRPGLLMWAGYANNLGNALSERHELDGDPADLDQAVLLFEQALTDARSRPLESSGYATNLGLALATRARLTGSLGDMDQALLRLGQSIDLLLPGHPDRAHRLSNLGDAYRQRSIMFNSASATELAVADAVAAVDTCQQAVQHAGTSDARLLPALSNLAQALRWRRDLEPGSVSARDVLDAQRQAATLEQITPAEKFGQSGRWARDAEEAGAGQEALKAYARAVSLTTDVAWIGLGVQERLNLLNQMTEVLCRAVAFAASANRPWLAIAWADHVRSVLWRQGLQVTALGRQRSDPHLTNLGLRPAEEPGGSYEGQRREQRRRLAHAESDALRMPPSSPSDYECLELPGVVVLLVPSVNASLALVLRTGRSPKLVPLPDAPQEELASRVQSLREASGFLSAPHNELRQELAARHGVFDCLDWLWEAVALPILNEVHPEPGERPHLWWSPVGEFALLPIHAAGRHPRKGTQHARRDTSAPSCLQDLVTSSYFPTILAPRPGRTAQASDAGHLLYVATDASVADLGHLAREREAVRAALAVVEIEELVDEDATIEALRAAIPECRFLHVAGHGSPALDDSLEAGFHLANGLFTLRDLATCEAESGQLAVVLTCDSATGDVQSPNEALHVAGAAHQAGFPDVVAAMLPLRDSSTVPVVTAIYRVLGADPCAGGHAIAKALDEAVRSLRIDAATAPDPLAWVPFAHFGAGIVRPN